MQKTYSEHARRFGPAADMTISCILTKDGGMRLTPGAMDALGSPKRVRLGSTNSGDAIVIWPAHEQDPNSYSLHHSKKPPKQPRSTPRSGALSANLYRREMGLVFEQYPVRLDGYRDENALVFPFTKEQTQTSTKGQTPMGTTAPEQLSVESPS